MEGIIKYLTKNIGYIIAIAVVIYLKIRNLFLKKGIEKVTQINEQNILEKNKAEAEKEILIAYENVQKNHDYSCDAVRRELHRLATSKDGNTR